MRKQKAIIDFSKVRDNDLSEIGQLIFAKMSSSTDFPEPPVRLDDLRAAILEYSDALVRAKDGTKQDTAIKNAKREVLEEMLTKNGNYVNLIADGDLVKLEGSGYPLTKLPEPVGILEQPKTFKVSDGPDPGAVSVEIGVVERAEGYIVLYYEVKQDGSEPPPDAQWQSKTFSKASGLITGLQSGKKYMFKSAATSPEANKISLYNFTEPVERFVQ